MTMNTWSKTAASNSNADATINWAEGQAPSSVNDSSRAVMAAVAKYRDDNAGTVTTGGTSTAYTATSNQVFASLSAMSGHSIKLKMSATNGASPTLNVDSLGAKNIVSVQGTAIRTGALVANGVYDFVYNNSTSEWTVIGVFSPEFASGTVMLFSQTNAPTGWTKGSTHNDKALRLTTGSVGTGGSTAFTSVFAARTITQAMLPNVTLAVNFSAGEQGVATGAGSNTAVATGVVDVYEVGVYENITATTASINGNQAQSTINFAVNYVDVILAQKD